MKIIKVILCALLVTIALGGCGKANISNTNTSSTNEENITALTKQYNPFVKVFNGDSYDIYVDRDTKVMYQSSDGSYNKGSWLVLVNADGTPRLYDRELD